MLPAPAFVVGTLVLLLPALVLAWCAALRRRERDRLAVERILRLQRRIDAALNDGFEGDSRRDFAALLRTASLTTDLQARRLRLQAGIDRQPPEKYRILGQLALDAPGPSSPEPAGEGDPFEQLFGAGGSPRRATAAPRT